MVSTQVIADLRRDEDWRGKPYRDSEGYLTIGYGFLIDERKPVTMPRAVGELWLQLEVESTWSELIYRLPWIDRQPENIQRALTNMAYNLGVTGLLEFKLMLGSLERGDYESAAANALDSKWATQVGVRAERIADLIRGHAKEGDD